MRRTNVDVSAVSGLALLALLLAAPGRAHGQPPLAHVGASLRPDPTRLTFGPGRTTGRITLTSSERLTLDVALTDRGMREDGAIVPLSDLRADPALAPIAMRVKSAKPFVVVRRKRITLHPGRPQAIAVSTRRPPTGTGEYRTHLTLTPAPDPKAPPPGATMQWSHALPLIVRADRADVRARLQAVKVAYGPGRDWRAPSERRRVLTFEIVREGWSSLYGDVVIRGADGVEIAAQRVAIYPELDRRRFEVPLPPAAAGPLHIAFIDRDLRPGALLASATAAAEPVRVARVALRSAD